MMRLEQPRAPLETPERELTRLPRHPGPGARQILCEGRGGKCQKWLGVTDGRYLFMNDGKRETVASLPASVRCERCGTVAMVS